MAYDNTFTHPDVLTKGAANLLFPDVPDNPYQEMRFYFAPSRGIRTGTIDEDNLPNPIHHFYNPFTHDGLFGALDAYDYAPFLWNAAVNDYMHGNKVTGYYNLGRTK